MLLRDVEIGIRDLGGQDEPIMFHAAGFTEFLEPFRAEHFTQRKRLLRWQSALRRKHRFLCKVLRRRSHVNRLLHRVAAVYPPAMKPISYRCR